jgi:hypothetical protein
MRWSAVLLFASGVVCGAVLVWSLSDSTRTFGAESIGVTLAGIGLLVGALVGYWDRVVVRHRCVITPVFVEFSEESITFRALLTNGGNRHVSISSVHLALSFGLSAGPHTSSWPSTPGPLDPIILQAQSAQNVTLSFGYSSRAIYNGAPPTELPDGRKRVEWLMQTILTDSFGAARGERRAIPLWRLELGPEGKVLSSGGTVRPITVLDETNWLGRP